MKKTWIMAAVIGLVAVMMSGCITATLVLSKLAADEQNEIQSGKVFEEKAASVTYRDGRVLTFIEYGKYIRVEDPKNNKLTIITPDSAYVCNTKSKTYSSVFNKNGTVYFSDLSMVFPKKWLELHRFVDDVVRDTNSHESTETFAGKHCTCFSDAGYIVGGYQRILMYRKNGSDVELEASKYNSSSVIGDYKVPEGYKNDGYDVEFAERF